MSNVTVSMCACRGIRAILEPEAAGDMVVRTTGQQGSGILRSMNAAGWFVILPPTTKPSSPACSWMCSPFTGYFEPMRA